MITPEVEPIAVTHRGDLWRPVNTDVWRRVNRRLCHLMANEGTCCFCGSVLQRRIDGHVCGSGSIKHREFAMASREMTEQEFAGFSPRFAGMHPCQPRWSLQYICVDWRHLAEMIVSRTPYIQSSERMRLE